MTLQRSALDFPGARRDDVYPSPRANCCFTADTLVLMADGRNWRISDIRPGDLLLSGQGLANRVVEVERVPLKGRRLNAINGSAPFFTAEQPFLTRRGWKSLDPRTSRQGPIGLVVRELCEGDILLAALSGPAIIGANVLTCALQIEDLPLVCLYSHIAEEQAVYNLLLDGDHTYVANGFVVHNTGGRARIARPSGGH